MPQCLQRNELQRKIRDNMMGPRKMLFLFVVMIMFLVPNAAAAGLVSDDDGRDQSCEYSGDENHNDDQCNNQEDKEEDMRSKVAARRSEKQRIMAELSALPTPSSFSSCRWVFAARGVEDDEETSAPQRKYGIFVQQEWKRGMPLGDGDLAIHLIDVDPFVADNSPDSSPDSNQESNQENKRSSLQKWHEREYLVDASTSGYGGSFEGLGRVMTLLPGVGMMSSSAPSSSTSRPNVWAAVPENDEANLPRESHPAAGSFALHHNLTFRVTHPRGIPDTAEVMVDRHGWHRRRALGINDAPVDTTAGSNTPLSRQKDEGICLDNLHPKQSQYGYGRGAHASRFLPRGSIVAPVPVLPIPRDELRYLPLKEWKKLQKWNKKQQQQQNHETGENASYRMPTLHPLEDASLPYGMQWRHQLALNYCFGHVNSSLLLFPYGLHVNLINHAPSYANATQPSTTNSLTIGKKGEKHPVANLGLRWSIHFHDPNNADKLDPRFKMTPEELFQLDDSEGLVLEYVALRDIQPNEELFFDYGSLWSTSYQRHVQHWNQRHGTHDANDSKHIMKSNEMEEYSPAYIMDDVVTNLRTLEEQINFPYPNNVFTACFYHYDANNNSLPIANDGGKIPSVPWKMSRGLFDMINLRPCRVIARDALSGNVNGQGAGGAAAAATTSGGTMRYTAIIQNRPNESPTTRIPKGIKHVVSGIPREAVRFVDRPYTSDIHLIDAFRREIGVEEWNLFPDSWLDLS